MSNKQQAGGHPQANMEQLQKNMAKIKKKILVLSGKGGVGKSTVAVNIASELARQGYKVGLLDVDLHGPSIPRMTGLTGMKCQVTNERMEPVKSNKNLSVMSVAFLLEKDDQAIIWRGPMKYAVIQKLLADTEWGELDYMVVDAPPGTGDEPLGVAQLVGVNAGAVIVTTPQKVAIEDVRRCITFCRQVMLPVWGIVENMSGMYCPHCEKEIKVFSKVNGGEELAKQTGLDYLGNIPIDPTIADGADQGLEMAECSLPAYVHQKRDEIIEKLIKKTQPAN